MKKLLLFFGLVLFVAAAMHAQDIPLFSQKLTNSFIYNPALAGHTYGSMTYSYRQNYSGVAGAPKNHFLSIHSPFMNHKVGAGINLFQEDVNFIRNTYASAAFAYHLRFNKFSVLSMGVGGEYNLTRLNGISNTENFIPDPVLGQLQNGSPTYDFSFGVNYQARFFKAGIAMNRLSTAWLNQESSSLSNYYSGYVNGMLPLRGGNDMLEPYFAFRKFSETNDTYDIGLFYTYDNKIILGGAVRKGNVVNGTIGFKPNKHILLGYSREMITSSIGGYIGSANEITLRYDFNDESYKERFRADYKNAMAYRRKTLSTPAKMASRNPKQLKKTQKKLAPFSPNTRYQNTQKLSMNRTSAPPKKSYGPTKKKSFNPKKKKKNVRSSSFRNGKYNPVRKK
jgi:type IX secretion system PorP/SprF family membrane protein